MNYATKEDVDSKKFEVVEAHNITVLVDPKAIFYIVGTEMDYEVSILDLTFSSRLVTSIYIPSFIFV